MDAQDIVRALQGGLLQQDRLLKLDTPLGSNVLLPQRVAGWSRIGRHYDFTLDVLSTRSDLKLKKLIGQPITLWIQQANRSYLPRHGYVYSIRRLGAEGGLTSYQIGFASWMNFLKFRRDQRIWQDKPVDEILSDVFNAHPQAKGQFKFALSKPLPQRSYCTQYEDDWNFVHRLMEAEGLFGIWSQAADGKSHMLTVTDHVDTCERLTLPAVQFSRDGANSEADALIHWSGMRSLHSAALTTRTFDYKNPSSLGNPKGTNVPTVLPELPEQLEMYEYTGPYTYLKQDRGDHLTKVRMEEWESSAKRFYGTGGLRAADAGRWFELVGHPEHDRDSTERREFVIVETVWLIENNLPGSSHHAKFPHGLQSRLAEAMESRGGGNASIVAHDDGAKGFFLVEIETQRKSVPYRSPFEHHKPVMQMQTATVVGPQGQEIYTDELGRVKVQFHWDRIGQRDERSSCWVRVAQPWSSAQFGGIQLPRIGDEVVVPFFDGDPDRPVITARVGNGSNRPQWNLPDQHALSGFVSKEIGGAQNNVWLKDDTAGQVQTQIRSDHLESGLHLGYLTRVSEPAGRSDKRGEGAELRTDGHAAVRGARGLLLSTHPRAGATGDAFNVDEVNLQLANAQDTAASLAQSAESAGAQDGEQKAVVTTLKAQAKDVQGGGTLKQFDKPHLVLGSPAGVVTSTPESIHISSGKTTALTTGTHVSVSTGGGLFASARKAIRLFVSEAGMRLIAAAGDIDVKTLKDSINLLAKLNVTVTASKITISAQQEVEINGGGSYTRWTSGQIKHGTSGGFEVHSANRAFVGPDSVSTPNVPALPPEKEQLHFALGALPGEGPQYVSEPYELYKGGAKIDEGVTDEFGRVVVKDHQPGTPAYQVKLANGGQFDLRVKEALQGDPDHADQRSNRGERLA
ncbi:MULTISPECIES: type VI secretion system Vgr family protein [Burkholderia]|jgi:type VI secretion system secreted protein VgrG|uniref:Type VI secretion system tip protein VgrG n=2 Tax=Burkholderia contaminans TaxID=488447 RepID=A0A1E3FMV5_9BURK|nr:MULTISPECIES: type VI secretion system Vgr family protein [Burkholderia]NUH43876.1 type VI secretion system tip protein VgrG [Streptomyces samsunensis]UTP24472.1 type VI secretion system tip protein VgrG [Burkholderia sp. FXe9]KKL32051.1 type VI secretion protein ImpA [Burkholderia contaminans LMG 23361]MBA9831964.1 type VI secretion system tip protein VgrG [Burkholderia contaminans]MBA9838659.1 type VI secretion system tip protein VgrG [Burkholderia contaminans]